MKWFHTLSVRSKLVSGFGIVVFLLAAVTIAAFQGLTKLQSTQHTLYHETFANVYDLMTLRTNFNAVQLDVLMLLDKKNTNVAETEKDISERLDMDENIIQRLLIEFRDDAFAFGKISDIHTLRTAFMETLHNEELPMFSEGKPEEARRIALGIQNERHARIRALTHSLEDDISAKALQMVENTSRMAQVYVATFALTGGAAVVVALALAIFLNRAIARYITERKEMETKLSASNAYTRNLIESSLDPLVTISDEGKITDTNKATEDVTGVPRDQLIGSDFSSYFTEPDRARQGYQQALSQGVVRDYPLSIRHVAGKVTDVVYNSSIYKNTEGMVQGVFAAARDVTERNLLETKVKERSTRLENVLQEAQEAVGVLTSSSSEILTAIAQLASGASEAASSVSETTTTVEEVRQTAQLSNQKSKDIAEAGQNAAKVLKAGQKNVEASVAEMNHIREQMGSIAETIVTLSEQSQAIGEITGTVNELAEQSNLLAVNAAIEAAQAGEQGKGFAVVAQEIKSLAEQSKQATGQVRSLLTDIQKAISNAVMATEQASKVVETGVTQSSQAGESILMAVEATVNVARASTQIAASSQQQLLGVDQVATAMENINQASIQNAQTTKQVESVAQNLHELSRKLQSLVEKSPT